MSDSSLNGKVAVVVGASSGMGKATSKTFAEAGAHMVLAARNEVALEALSAEIVVDCLVCPTDATDVSSVENLIKRSLDKFGRVDVLVYATGTNIPDRSLERLSHETLGDDDGDQYHGRL
ncbi:MAG: SDR family NAD(P)-dependent oxidoreductase [Verrucomicrobia bacterium]|nr:SDR family NAD(P)-dependent oxidoreductase [Verrucomicrobiota bacterium]